MVECFCFVLWGRLLRVCCLIVFARFDIGLTVGLLVLQLVVLIVLTLRGLSCWWVLCVLFGGLLIVLLVCWLVGLFCYLGFVLCLLILGLLRFVGRYV